jgi:hypothetical protein
MGEARTYHKRQKALGEWYKRGRPYAIPDEMMEDMEYYPKEKGKPAHEPF